MEPFASKQLFQTRRLGVPAQVLRAVCSNLLVALLFHPFLLKPKNKAPITRPTILTMLEGWRWYDVTRAPSGPLWPLLAYRHGSFNSQTKSGPTTQQALRLNSYSAGPTQVPPFCVPQTVFKKSNRPATRQTKSLVDGSPARVL